MPEAPTAADKMADDSGAAPGLGRTMVAGREMSAGQSILVNLQGSPQHTSFVAALTAGKLEETLSEAGVYTVFAPTDAAFSSLPAAPNAPLSQTLAGAHVVPGRLTAFELSQRMQMGAGQLRTVTGAPLTITSGTDGLRVRGASGREARVLAADALQSNGVVHVIDTVLAP